MMANMWSVCESWVFPRKLLMLPKQVVSNMWPSRTCRVCNKPQLLHLFLCQRCKNIIPENKPVLPWHSCSSWTFLNLSEELHAVTFLWKSTCSAFMNTLLFRVRLYCQALVLLGAISVNGQMDPVMQTGIFTLFFTFWVKWLLMVWYAVLTHLLRSAWDVF